MIDALLGYTFMQNALIAALLASISAGIIGTIAIEKKLISMSGGIAHASFGGIGLGYLAGFEPIWGGLAFAVAASVLVGKRPGKGSSADTMTGILWALGMALGILFISLAPGYMPDMTSYLFGDILAVSTDSLIYMGAFTAAVLLVFLALRRPLVLYLFDESFAAARGIKTGLLKWTVYIIIPIGIIVLIKVVGVILTIALMTIPVSIAKLYCRSVGKVIAVSAAISFALCIVGLVVSYYVNIPSGVCIIVLGAVVYLLLLATRGTIQRWLHRRHLH